MKMTQSGTSYDAVVVGAGFSGLYALHKLRDHLGLSVRLFEKGTSVGGTWHWNRYPGALSDSETYVYAYSFDDDLLQQQDLSTRYATQPQVLRYLESVVERKDLARDIQLDTTVNAARFDETANQWVISTSTGQTVTSRYLVTGLGPLSAANVPEIDGIDTFDGQVIHTSKWPETHDFTGKRVGVVGTGSTGVQLITAIASEVGELTVFQRTPQYCVPLRNRPLEPQEIADIRSNYKEIWNSVYNSGLGFGFVESEIPAMSVSPEQRRAIFEEAWQKGGGFYFMFGTFSDIGTNPEANEEAAAFIRTKIAEIVDDPETARKLTPTDYYARRPVCDSGYYATFNRDNVSLVDVRETPIVKVTPRGVVLSDGAEIGLDVLIFATGFDAVEGSYRSIDIRGRGGVKLADHWSEAPRGYLGMTVAGFPNLFTIFGPNSSFCNNPPMISSQVDWIGRTVGFLERSEHTLIEPTGAAEDRWMRQCEDIANQTLFPKVESWIFGHNVKGKPTTARFYMGGLSTYRGILDEVTENGYDGFVLSS
ncbi:MULTISPECIES: flavin-containing monooxygenase [Amycolatopsis]|uniref:Predicted flavoprotein CzcO associated with the cation diffusion facilitator CzcD n=2 Tax=Amycolatopsis TaxID=1813 RepID=A0A1I3KC91_9PSEU|nr:NAD(P)/FAD-dependent oxidoreductase [Amycolatopsis sacchari]SFI70102.1 Predicted flavoprotein CzcO associated with the cation diffusion facilitator CzcD [Amycolatopsis sacchari]